GREFHLYSQALTDGNQEGNLKTGGFTALALEVEGGICCVGGEMNLSRLAIWLRHQSLQVGGLAKGEVAGHEATCEERDPRARTYSCPSGFLDHDRTPTHAVHPRLDALLAIATLLHSFSRTFCTCPGLLAGRRAGTSRSYPWSQAVRRSARDICRLSLH